MELNTHENGLPGSHRSGWKPAMLGVAHPWPWGRREKDVARTRNRNGQTASRSTGPTDLVIPPPKPAGAASLAESNADAPMMLDNLDQVLAAIVLKKKMNTKQTMTAVRKGMNPIAKTMANTHMSKEHRMHQQSKKFLIYWATVNPTLVS
ncbi:hypothetical protein NDU88_001266 [Pleurodeles waltl]|uniref:Uncharacterized protein n=1 Tax=Pleurodeles waltl TaxID=8319 RepID=A0AAV7KR03_PLEWA|nr:hypothetical protein NDU88_001266 [Pleurodeles waltl]